MKHLDLETCESTNDEAWKFAHEPEPVLISTRQQTRGKGRQGREWKMSSPSNIAASLVFKAEGYSSQQIGWISMLAGIAAVDCLDADKIRLKWPNDLYVHSQKLGGILCETRSQGSLYFAVVVGIGINVANAPSGATSLRDAGLIASDQSEVARAQFLAQWPKKFATLLKLLQEERYTMLQERWLQYAKLDLYPNFETHDRTGALRRVTATGIDERGQLLATYEGRTITIDQAN